MKELSGIHTFASGIGLGALLVSGFAAATVLFSADPAAEWLARQLTRIRSRRNRERVERLTRNSLDYLDAFRAAGL